MILQGAGVESYHPAKEIRQAYVAVVVIAIIPEAGSKSSPEATAKSATRNLCGYF